MTQKNKFTRGNLEQTVDAVYEFVVRYIRGEGYPPSVREICTGVGIRSTSTIHAHLRRLHDMGKIEYTPGKRRAIIVPQLQEEAVLSIPVIGTVTAGTPILATESIERTLPFSSEMYGDGEHFVLRVRGDSMIEAHIKNGDYVVVRKQDTAMIGQIVVALIDDEATVKTFGIQNGEPALFPQNHAYQPIPFRSENCRILGLVRGLFRDQV